MSKSRPASGKYNKRFTLMRSAEGALGDYGATTENDSDVEIARLWGSLWPVRGDEYYRVAQVQSAVTHIVRTWYRGDITFSTADWLELGSRRFEISSAIDINEAHVEMELRVIEKTT